jgi:chromosome segregation and condensation protein ScpB
MWKEIDATEFIWKETAATEPLRTTAQPVTEEELSAIFNRLDSARDVLRQNRELRSRNAELEEILRQFAPTLLNMATTVGLAARDEKPDTFDAAAA